MTCSPQAVLTTREAVSARCLRNCRPSRALFGRIDLGDFPKAVGFGVMWPRDERSAHFCAVPARYDTEPERLFGFDVARRKILHGVCFQFGVRLNRAREAFRCYASNNSFSSLPRA